MFIDELHFLLLTAASLDQSPDCLKTKCVVCKGYLAGLVDTVAILMVNKTQQPYKNTYTRNTSCFKHGLCPLVRIGSDQRSFPKQPDSSIPFSIFDLFCE